MKKNLLFSFIFLVFIVRSQTTLTQSFNEPKPGDIENTYELDTSAYAAGLPLNVTGNTATWNFINLKAIQPVLISSYLSAASVTSSSSYTGCTFVQDGGGGAYTYFKSTTTPTTQTELLGINTASFSANFNNSGIIAKYPITYGSSSTDNMSGSFTYSTITGTASGNITTTADGLGTLNLPQGYTLANVIRVKSIQTITLTAGFIPVGTLKQTIYNFYHASQKFPVLSLNYSKLSSSFTSSPTTTGFATGSMNYFVTGIKENSLQSSSINLYPNPAQSLFSVEISTPFLLKEIKLFNQLGELVLKSEDPENIDISGLSKGIYMVEIYTDKGIGRKKIVKE